MTVPFCLGIMELRIVFPGGELQRALARFGADEVFEPADVAKGNI
jgi:hypothetical protein